jgi:hypothetical protein
MFVRYPAPPGRLPRSLKVTRSPITGEVVVIAGPPLPKTPGDVWEPSGRAEEDGPPLSIFPTPTAAAGR